MLLRDKSLITLSNQEIKVHFYNFIIGISFANFYNTLIWAYVVFLWYSMCIFGRYDIEFYLLISSLVSVGSSNRSIWLILLFALKNTSNLSWPTSSSSSYKNVIVLPRTIYKHCQHSRPLWFLLQNYLHYYEEFQIGIKVS